MGKSIEALLDKLRGIKFCFIGSANLLLQGLQVEPHDLDLLTDDEGIMAIANIFGTSVRNYEGFQYKETKFSIDNTEVHVVSNNNNPLRPKEFGKETIFVNKNGLNIPCMNLQSELEFYRRVNRDKDKQKVLLIKDFLRK